MDPNRREHVDDRVIIRKQTDSFLEKVTTTGYALLKYDRASEVLRQEGATFTGGLPAFGSEGTITQPSPYVTGAKSPLLPMKISLADKDGFRITFTMLINPTNINHGKASSVFSSYTRNGYITQLWGANQDLISSTGKTAAFMVEGIGLTNVARRRSFSYVNFLSLLYAYRNNGYQFLDPVSFKDTLTRVVNIIHGVELSYDNQTFMGHFNNFTLDESADRPYLFDYNYEFVVSSLSEDYHEVKGHFTPIKDIETNTEKPRKLDEVNENSIIGD
jgi:hypothetical protein